MWSSPAPSVVRLLLAELQDERERSVVLVPDLAERSRVTLGPWLASGVRCCWRPSLVRPRGGVQVSTFPAPSLVRLEVIDGYVRHRAHGFTLRSDEGV